MMIRNDSMTQAKPYLAVFALFFWFAGFIVGRDSSATTRPRDPSQETNFTLEGKINKQSPGKLTISGEGNIIFHAAYNDKTVIKRMDGSSGSSKDLRVGMTVRVEGELTESGEIVAHKIEIQSEGPSK